MLVLITISRWWFEGFLALGGGIHLGHTASKLVRLRSLPQHTSPAVHLRWRRRLATM